jgi:hypothetical protein
MKAKEAKELVAKMSASAVEFLKSIPPTGLDKWDARRSRGLLERGLVAEKKGVLTHTAAGRKLAALA